jgi:hypothetical protein
VIERVLGHEIPASDEQIRGEPLNERRVFRIEQFDQLTASPAGLKWKVDLEGGCHPQESVDAKRADLATLDERHTGLGDVRTSGDISLAQSKSVADCTDRRGNTQIVHASSVAQVAWPALDGQLPPGFPQRYSS